MRRSRGPLRAAVVAAGSLRHPGVAEEVATKLRSWFAMLHQDPAKHVGNDADTASDGGDLADCGPVANTTVGSLHERTLHLGDFASSAEGDAKTNNNTSICVR